MYVLYQTEGIVLAMWPRGEGDRVLRLYTERYGSVTLTAKGTRLEKSKLRGDIELFSKTRIGFVAGKEIYRLTHAEVLDYYARVRADFDRYRAGSILADMVRGAVADGEKDEHLWRLCLGAFAFINGAQFQRAYTHVFIRAFEIKFLHCLGYLPQRMPRAAEELLAADAFLPGRALTLRELQEISIFLQSIRKYASSSLFVV